MPWMNFDLQDGKPPIGFDLKRWEMCSPAPVASAAGSFIVSSRHFKGSAE